MKRVYTGVYAAVLVLLCASCGLETYYVLEPPTGSVRLGSTDPVENYLSFFPNSQANVGLVQFRGVDVYYRLYNNYDRMLSDYNSINAVNTEYSDTAARRLISLGFVPLSSQPSRDPLISRNENGEVRVRFFTEGSGNDAYRSSVTLNGTEIAQPMRYQLGKGFDFFDSNDQFDADKGPEEKDADVYISGSARNIWYVSAYAIAVGRDENYTTFYSEVFHMGWVSIQK